MSWDLTFIYAQELRSKSMNDILRGVSRPGVYKPNMYLYTTDNTNTPAVWIKILKGTTLMFANGRDVSGAYKRDLDDVGDYLIKAVANDDISVELLQTNGGQNLLSQSGGAPWAPILYVGAEYLYNPDISGDTNISIKLYRPNYTNANISGDVDPLPNEDMDSGYENLKTFLILGTIINTQTTGMVNYFSDITWINGSEGEDRWLQDNIFTARGLPDYSRRVSRDFQKDLPDLIFARDIKNIFLTEGTINYNGAIYDIAGKTWRTQYGYGGDPGTSYETGEPSVAQGFIIDKSYLDLNQDTWDDEGVALDTPSKLYVTLVFMALKGKSSESIDPTLSTLLNIETIDATYKLLPITIEMDANALETNTNSGALNGELFGGISSIIPLDVSVNNISRLKSVFSNKAILHKVVDYMRRNEDLKPYLNPDNGETIIPIFAGFRSTDGSGVFDDPQTVTSLGINPTNCLTLKDFQGVPESNLNNVIENVFDILSIID